MKANEFIKEHGLQYTKSIIEQFPNHTHVTNDGRMFIDENTCCNHIKYQLGELVKMDELKRLVEAHEIIRLFKSLDHAKIEAQACENSKHSEILVKLDIGVGYIWLSRVKQAILDVESCQ